VIRVHITVDDSVDFPEGTRFTTEDAFNNLCIWVGDKGDMLTAVFADGKWVWVEASADG